MAITAGSDIVAADFISTSAGAGDSGKVPKLASDGTLDGSFMRTPIVRTYTVTSGTWTNYGSSTSRFDITNPSGSVFRYTWDGTGTDPTISAATFPVGKIVKIRFTVSTQISYLNCGLFIIRASGTNYFEVYNPSGVAENDKTLNDGTYNIIEVSQNSGLSTWTKPAGLRYVIIEVQGGGGGGGGAHTAATEYSGAGGGGGGYCKKLIAVGSLGATETIYVGLGGTAGGSSASAPTFGQKGAESSFGSTLIALGGKAKNGSGITRASIGGTAIGGDINLIGGDGDGYGSSNNEVPPHGGQGYVGGNGGYGADQNTTTPLDGYNGLVVVTEYY